MPECYQTHKTKTLMEQKNLITQANDSANHLTLQDVSAELVELSEKDLEQIFGGVRSDGGPGDGVRAASTPLTTAVPPPPPPPPEPWHPPLSIPNWWFPWPRQWP